jgi:hypothetical protein
MQSNGGHVPCKVMLPHQQHAVVHVQRLWTAGKGPSGVCLCACVGEEARCWVAGVW